MRYNEVEDSPVIEVDDDSGRLVRTYNVLRAVSVIDNYCSELNGRCWSCPLHVRTENFEFVCRVLHKKWKAEAENNDTYDLTWDERKNALKNYCWRSALFGNNFLWYKKKNYVPESTLKKMSDQDFMTLVVGKRITKGEKHNEDEGYGRAQSKKTEGRNRNP